jgi:hypothetical protein
VLDWNYHQERVLTEAMRQRPSVLYRPMLSIDGDKWCALYGANLMEGVAGFGESPETAMADFDRAWTTTLAKRAEVHRGE